ncbi:uncharacterized protein ACWYII_030545 [Salvelinus alpinus]
MGAIYSHFNLEYSEEITVVPRSEITQDTLVTDRSPGQQCDKAKTGDFDVEPQSENSDSEAGQSNQNTKSTTQVTNRSPGQQGDKTNTGNILGGSPSAFGADDNIEDVDKFNVYVKCAGKTVDIEVFPLEKIAVLLENGCQKAGKNPCTMQLVYNGEILNKSKTVQHYKLRRGSSVNLIRAG